MIAPLHTPGPWHVEVDDGTHYICHPGTVCVVTTICELDADGSTNIEADARLIAAAPDMLAALEALNEHARPTNWDEQDDEFAEDAVAHADAWRKLDAALAKVRVA